jgi:N-acyl-D-aspartate/D-glutamate deacylase|tara:strand:+ start:14015 stop:15706 length:1692 start_codon:yes stop_codon:yes gene_type:complete
MSHDTIISGATIIDGTGGEPISADIAIDGERISRIGDLTGVDAGRKIDAEGKIVTPGFVDLHTHLDAQVGWDPEMKSSSYHGVTTALIGNCGVTFAPVSQGNHRLLAELMEAVEDIGANAIMDGLPWNWSSYGEYLDSVQSLKPALNIVGLAGHSAIRFEAMGDKSMDEGVQATPSELEHIKRLVKESVEEGAVGFSTSRFLGHHVPDGRLTPGTWADLNETRAIQQAIIDGGGTGGLFQVAPDMASRREIEFEMFKTGAELGCHVMYSGGAGGNGDGGVGRTAQFLDKMNEGGRRMTSVCHTRPSGAMFGLAQSTPFRNSPWKELMALPTIADRVVALKDPATRERLITRSKETGFRADPALLHPMGMGDVPDYDMGRENSLEQLAARQGKDPVEVYVDRLIESEGRELWNFWAFGGALENQWAYMKMDHCVPMLADAGAHVGIFTDTDSPTFLLAELTRRQGVYTLPEAVHRITLKSADVLGLKERGAVKEGWIADLNIIDYENLETGYPYYVNDFPHNGGRYIVESAGYLGTMVAGNMIVENGKHTGSRPGTVIREFARN